MFVTALTLLFPRITFGDTPLRCLGTVLFQDAFTRPSEACKRCCQALCFPGAIQAALTTIQEVQGYMLFPYRESAASASTGQFSVSQRTCSPSL